MWRQKWGTGEYQWTGAYEDAANDENDDDDDDDADDTKGITLDNKYDSEDVYHHNKQYPITVWLQPISYPTKINGITVSENFMKFRTLEYLENEVNFS